MKPKHLLPLLTSIAVATLSITALAHGGRTDSSGGHKDNRNVSGLGSYHYHCGGRSAHLHKDGVCPYSTKAKQTPPKQQPTKK